MRYLLLMLAALAVIPTVTAAHEHYEYEIGSSIYEITIGSLNEPLVVDDKSGVDFRVAKREAPMGSMEGHEDHASHGGGTPVVGLEETLSVELISGTTKRSFDLTPVYSVPGSYKAQFYPTEAVELAYRIHGTIEGIAFDQTYACAPAGHNSAPEDLSRVDVSEGVVRTLKSGAFSCPVAKATLGFPSPSVSLAETSAAIDHVEFLGYAALLLAGAALLVTLARRY